MISIPGRNSHFKRSSAPLRLILIELLSYFVLHFKYIQDYKEERYKGYAVSKMNLCEDGHEKRHEEDSVSKINLNEHVRDEEDSVQFEKPPSPQPSYVSLKSDISMVEPCTFHDKTSASFLG